VTDLSPTGQLSPALEVLPAEGATRAVVLVLHGGKAVSREPSLPKHLSVARLVPFAEAVHAASASGGVATWRVRYRYRGWNGADASPVADARWALDEVRRRHGDVPVVLLGHSMGARTALRVADDPAVRTVVALAPWLPGGEPVEAARDRRILLAHAPRDRWTSPRESAQWAQRAESLAERLVYVRVRRAGHFMLRRSRLWTSIAVAFVLDGLATDLGADFVTGASAQGPGANLLRKAQEGTTLLTS
jgi:pimeloyl-ACP methyl ester carboxylesterase